MWQGGKAQFQVSFQPPVALTRSNRRGTDPYARWCGRGGAARLPPIPINTLCLSLFRLGQGASSRSRSAPSGVALSPMKERENGHLLCEHGINENIGCP